MGCANIIFIHIPKTAGVSIGHGFMRDGHLKPGFRVTHSYGKNLVSEHDKNRIVLGVVRNPYDRLWSLYEFYRKKRKNIQTDISFENFILDYEKDFYPKGEKFSTCLDYLTDKDGKMLTTDIIRFENLEKDYASFCEKYQIQNTLKHANKNEEKEPNPEYTPQMREVVERVFRKDLDTFNYSYESYLENIKNTIP